MNPRPPALALCCLVAVAGVVAVLAVGGDGPSAPAPAVTPTATPAVVAPSPDRPELRALRVLRAWDARRADAWAAGDPAALSALYVEGSRAGRADRAMLRRYAERGLRVTGLRMQLLEVDVVQEERRTLVLRVIDRLARAVARGHGRAVVLPRDQPTTRLVVLSRSREGWRVVVVTGQASAAASTASTSRSRKE